jgi:hypothetical protein
VMTKIIRQKSLKKYRADLNFIPGKSRVWTQGQALDPNSAPRGGVLYPPLMAGLFDLQISIHFVFEIWVSQ